MATRNRLAFLIGLVTGFAGIAAWRLYSSRALDRVQSHEGLDDPAIARGFEKVATLPPLRVLRWYAIRRALRLQYAGDAIDIGCGSGRLAVELALRAPCLTVTGIDLSAEMLEMARESAVRVETTCPGALANRVEFRLGDAARIPLDDASVDLVISTLSLHHWGDPVQVMDEIARVLRPNGSYMVFDLRRDVSFPFWLLLWLVSHLVVPAALRRIREPLASRDASYTLEEVTALADASRLSGWRIEEGPFWVILEGTMK